jgi:hypothetical protein
LGSTINNLRIHFDGDAKRHPGVFHATDSMRYLDAKEE